ncbi:MAG: hypothetical protein ABI668_03370 [Sphingorhabdus sp.]
MTQPQLIMAIGRIERALSRLEQAPYSPAAKVNNTEINVKYERLKAETKAAIDDLDKLLSGQER